MGLECEVCVDGIHLEHVSEVKYLGCVLDESVTVLECGEWEDGVRSLVNARSLQFECARVLHQSLLVLVLTYCSDTMIWREKGALGLGLYRWTTLEVYWVSGEWIKS